MVPRGVALAAVVAAALVLLGRGLDPSRTGAALALLFLAAEAMPGQRALGSWRIVLLALGPLLVPFVRERAEPGPALASNVHDSGSSGNSRPCHARFLSFTAASSSANL